MPHTSRYPFQKSLLAAAIGSALTPAWALDLVQEPPLPTSKSAFVAPNVIISVDDSGSMNYCSNYEGTNGCPTTINNSSRTITTAYACTSGYSADSSNPINCEVIDNTRRSVSYSCTNGYTLSGTDCKKGNKKNNKYRITTYSCSSGSILDSNNDCIVTDNTKRIETVTTSCGTGKYLDKKTGDCYDTGSATNESTPPWKKTTKRINVLKYALNNVFKDPALVPDGKIRLAWQSLNNTGTTDTKTGDVNPPEEQNINSMRPLKGNYDVVGTHRNNFIKFVFYLNQTYMRKLFVLRTCIDFAFYISCLTVLVMIIFIPIAILGFADGIPFKMEAREIIIENWQSKLLLVFVLTSSLFFVYSIYLLRKTVVLFIKGDVFNEQVINNFRSIGLCVISSTLLFVIPSFIYNAIHSGEVGLSFELGFDSPLLVISLGLFFMVLSEVFQKAKNLKEENDLTL